MIKEISYSSYAANPSDYESPDGQLAYSLDVVMEDGALRPVLPPKKVMKLSDGEKVVLIHNTASVKYYIILNESTSEVFCTDGESEKKSIYKFPLSTVFYGFNAMGNTLIVLTDTGSHYILWKGVEEGYLYLGTHMPECPISFGLQGEMIKGEEFTISCDSIDFYNGDLWKDLTDSNKTKITSQVLAKVNKFIADNSTNVGKFMYPFFVRYAYRLYDGSLTMHSAPVLMVCSSDLAPQCFVTNLKGDSSTTVNEVKLVLASMFHQLDYAVTDSSAIESLKNWNDIIKSIDIFVSAPIYTYNQNGECTKFLKNDYSDCYAICKHTNQAASTSTYPLRYQKSKFSELYAMTFDPTNFTAPLWRLMLPQREGDAIKGDISDNALFYLLKSINVEDLSTTRTIIPVNKEYLQSLQAREVMTDDYDSHDTLVPRYSYNYNSRLNIANLKKTLFDGYNAQALFQYTDGNVHKYSDDSVPTDMDRKVSVSVYYFIKQDGKDIVVHENAGGAFGVNTPYIWLFYPNINAYKAVVSIVDYFTNYYEVKLSPHPTLNGAYYFGGWEGLNISDNSVSSRPSASADKSVDVPNKIYTSEVNNPFYFPLSGINTIGTGKIMGISSATRALSQGQFGQFPLYVFTTEGIWALSVASDGTYSSEKAVTRDVCINSDSITQIDTAVLFCTNRGIMIISGSETACISDPLDSSKPFDIGDGLPNAKSLVSIYNEGVGENEIIDISKPNMDPFRLYLSECGMIYDYTNQRLIVYNHNNKYGYVYSLKSKAWGMMHCDILSSVNSYPEALAVTSTETEDGLKTRYLVDYSQEGAQSVRALIVTRPIKISPDVLKTIDTVIQRGYFQNGNISQVLYGSRDLFNWHIVWSSKDRYLRGFRGTPYKYFRIAIIANINKEERITGCTIQFYPRFTNKPR